MAGDDEYLLDTGDRGESKQARDEKVVKIAHDVISAVREVVKMDALAIKEQVKQKMKDEKKVRPRDVVERELSEGRTCIKNMDKVTLSQWRELLHPDRLVPVTLWDSNRPECWERLWRAEAGQYEAAFLHFTPFPRGPGKGNLTDWVNRLAALTQFHEGSGAESQLLVCGPLDPADEEGVVRLREEGSRSERNKAIMLNGSRWRSVLQLPDPNRDETIENVAELIEWQWRDDMKEGELLRQAVLLSDMRLTEHALLSGEQTSAFLTHGPSSNSAHWDAISGGSCCVFGWKLFVTWDACEWHVAIGLQAGLGEIAPPIPIANLCKFPSLRWTLVGPNTTIILPADRPHFVITLTSSLLVAFCHTSFPHQLMRSMAHVLAAQMPTAGTWMEHQSVDRLLQMIVHLQERTSEAAQHWSAEKKRVAKEEWVRFNREVSDLLKISQAVDALPGLKDLSEARAESEAVLLAWASLDSVMKNL